MLVFYSSIWINYRFNLPTASSSVSPTISGIRIDLPATATSVATSVGGIQGTTNSITWLTRTSGTRMPESTNCTTASPVAFVSTVGNIGGRAWLTCASSAT